MTTLKNRNSIKIYGFSFFRKEKGFIFTVNIKTKEIKMFLFETQNQGLLTLYDLLNDLPLAV